MLVSKYIKVFLALSLFTVFSGGEISPSHAFMMMQEEEQQSGSQASENVTSPDDQATQADTENPEAQTEAQVPELKMPMADRQRLETFVDGLVSSTMDSDHINGLTLSVVNDGEVVLVKGYGEANATTGQAVSGDDSLFRIGSISKLFTYLSIMQMVEEGKFDLNTPVNNLLPNALKIDNNGYEEPVLVWHLLSHTAGFEDTALGHLFVDQAGDIMPMTDYLQKYAPKRVRLPGVLASYSNYSVALAGAIVVQQSGMSFNDYVEQNIFQPLGMDESTFRELVPGSAGMSPAMRQNLSQGFRFEKGDYSPQPFEFISQIGPAGGMSASAEDMARFMMATLNYGELDGQRILTEQTARQMRAITFSNGGDSLPGIAHGFMTRDYGPYTAFGHGGATLTFFSFMMMIDETDTGIFVSTNTNTGRAASMRVVDKIMTYLHPEMNAGDGGSSQVMRGEIDRYLGNYMSTRRGYSTIEKFLLGFDSYVTVARGDNDTLVTYVGNQATKWQQVEPLVFQKLDADDRLVFKADEDGSIISLSYGLGITVAEKVGFWQGRSGLTSTVLITLITALLTIIRNWTRSKPHYRETIAEAFAARLNHVLSFVWIAWIIVFAIAVMNLSSDVTVAMFDYPTKFIMISVWLGNGAVVLTLVSVLALWSVWNEGRWPFSRRIMHTVVSFVFLTMSILAFTWKLVGFGVV